MMNEYSGILNRNGFQLNNLGKEKKERNKIEIFRRIKYLQMMNEYSTN